MIAASMALVALGAVLLVVGVVDGGLALVWASIACCLAAGALLIAGVVRARPGGGPADADGGWDRSPAAAWPPEYEGPGYPPPPDEAQPPGPGER